MSYSLKHFEVKVVNQDLGRGLKKDVKQLWDSDSDGYVCDLHTSLDWIEEGDRFNQNQVMFCLFNFHNGKLSKIPSFSTVEESRPEAHEKVVALIKCPHCKKFDINA